LSGASSHHVAWAHAGSKKTVMKPKWISGSHRSVGQGERRGALDCAAHRGSEGGTAAAECCAALSLKFGCEASNSLGVARRRSRAKRQSVRVMPPDPKIATSAGMGLPHMASAVCGKAWVCNTMMPWERRPVMSFDVVKLREQSFK
jgi:hypothetical protein